MSEGFFSESELLETKAVLPLIARCGICELYKSCRSPKMPVYGEGKREILVVGESPGTNEDHQNRPFVGRSGQYLRRKLQELGIQLDRDCWITNSIICHASKDGRNRNPTTKEIGYCRPNLIQTVERLKPKIIILLGEAAVRSLIGHVWKEDPGAIGRWIKWTIPLQRYNCWVCPTWHPSYMDRLLRSDKEKDRRTGQLVEMFFVRHLEKAVSFEKRPWKNIPNYSKRIQVELDATKAAEVVRRLTKGDHPVAWDIETNMLKPDSSEAEIVSCSLSDGETTIAYPWYGETIKATKEFVQSPIPKIGCNAQFESRWCMKLLGFDVANWVLDTMLAAHVLDNRSGITSIKFQAFALLGQESWNEHIAPFFKASHANAKNRIREIPIEKLCRYNGLDSLLEWKVAMKQSKELGIKL